MRLQALLSASAQSRGMRSRFTSLTALRRAAIAFVITAILERHALPKSQRASAELDRPSCPFGVVFRPPLQYNPKTFDGFFEWPTLYPGSCRIREPPRRLLSKDDGPPPGSCLF